MITNYTELKTEVASWAHRTDLTSKMDTFCQLAEAMINKDLRSLENIGFSNIFPTSVDISLPSDFLEMRWVISDKTSHLVNYPRDALDTRFKTTSGKPRGYSIAGTILLIRPGGSVADPLDIDLEYYKRVDTLTSNSTNSVLTAWPMIYFCAMMIQVNLFVQDDDEIKKWAEAYAIQVKQANRTASVGQYVQPQVRMV